MIYYPRFPFFLFGPTFSCSDGLRLCRHPLTLGNLHDLPFIPSVYASLFSLSSPWPEHLTTNPARALALHPFRLHRMLKVPGRPQSRGNPESFPAEKNAKKHQCLSGLPQSRSEATLPSGKKGCCHARGKTKEQNGKITSRAWFDAAEASFISPTWPW